jgi:xylulokinase
MLLCGIDVGTSSIKLSVVDASTKKVIHTCSFPETENEIISVSPGFAEQNPEHWWYCVMQVIKMANATKKYNPIEISAIGISYQMHGLVILDKDKQVLRPSIIWCDSRAANIGNQAFEALGKEEILKNLLNSPGNFTASKLAWVKENEPLVYDQIEHVLLPGDYISYKFTNELTTTISALSEGIFWDFNKNEISKDLLNYYNFDISLFPEIKQVFENHGQISSSLASELGLSSNLKITYKAGDQPNNALSLGVVEPGEIATTAGTSGVIYGISSELKYDPNCRVNSFAHVNYSKELRRIGVLMCINGTGILNRWLKDNFFPTHSYTDLNNYANQSEIGSKGLMCFPYGNGAERIFNNKIIGGSFRNLDFNRHQKNEISRSVQEGIAFSMVYGLELLNSSGIEPQKIKAGYSNMYLSSIFSSTIVNASNVSIQLLESDGAYGAALGAGIGSKLYATVQEGINSIKVLSEVLPDQNKNKTLDYYEKWKQELSNML